MLATRFSAGGAFGTTNSTSGIDSSAKTPVM